MMPHRSASDVVRSAAAALGAERWGDVLPLVRPDAVQSFRDRLLQSLIDSEARTEPTVEQFQPEQPWLPQAVAAYYAAEQEHERATRRLAHEHAEWGVSSFAELEPLAAEDFFVRYLAASSPAARLRGALAVSGNPPKHPADVAERVEAARRRRWVVLGEVREGMHRAHVLYREFVGDERYDPDSEDGSVQITTLDLVDGEWWLRIDHTFLA